MKVKDVIWALQEFAPEKIQESWDNSGFMVGDREAVVNKVLLALDCTEEIVAEAIDMGANLIITHHPLIFKGLKSVGNDTYVERVVKTLIKQDISLYSIHTNIDKVPDGVSGLMADKLSLRNREILNADKDPGQGLGIVGDLENPMDVVAFIGMVKDKFGLKWIRSSDPVKEMISRIALCGGSGSSLIGAARASGAQVYISGDISYHNFFCEPGFMVMDIGHYESEIGVLDLIKEIILKKIPNFAVCKSNKNNNPIHYH